MAGRFNRFFAPDFTAICAVLRDNCLPVNGELLPMATTSFYLVFWKRFADSLLAAAALLCLAPVMAVIAVLIRLKLGKAVLFRHQRPGKNGVPFILLKFRTMTDARDAKGVLLPDAERQTSFGNFLRNSSLDELPELVNVLKGEMSLVGPRPLMMEYL